MKPLFEDTTLEAQAILIEGYRKMTHAQTIAIVGSLNRTARRLAEAEERSRDPEASDEEILHRVAARYLPPDLLAKVIEYKRQRAEASSKQADASKDQE